MKVKFISQLLILGPIMVLIYYLHINKTEVLTGLSILFTEVIPSSIPASIAMTIWFISTLAIFAMLFRLVRLVFEGSMSLSKVIPLLCMGLASSIPQILILIHFFTIGILNGGLSIIQQQIYIPYFLLSISNILFLWGENTLEGVTYV